MMMIYADHNATTPLSSKVCEVMAKGLNLYGNPSSTHRLGRQSREEIEMAREQVANALEVETSELVFTSGGSEANTSVILGSYLLNRDLRVLSTTVEHSSVKESLEFLKSQGALVEKAGVLSSGELDWNDFVGKFDALKPQLVSVMAANNETGVVFPIEKIATFCKERGALFHTDAVQAFGKIPSSLFNKADFVSISAHKIYGPKGIGALKIRKGLKLQATHFGGSQETKRRGGTQNLLGILGFGAAASQLPMLLSEKNRIETLRDRFERKLSESLEVSIQGISQPRLPNTSNIRFRGVSSEPFLVALDLDGIYLSAGSACSSGSISPSHVLLAMGLNRDEAKQCLRFSWGLETQEQHIDNALELVIKHVNRIKQRQTNGNVA